MQYGVFILLLYGKVHEEYKVSFFFLKYLVQFTSEVFSA